MKTIILSEEQINFIKQEWSEEYKHYGDGCLCGSYVCEVKDIGFVVANVSCRKSSNCPDGMSWYINDNIEVYNKSIVSEHGELWDYEDLEERDIHVIGELNDSQALKLKEIVRQAMIRDYSFNGYSDEFGNDIREEIGKVIDFGLNTDDSKVILKRNPDGWYLELTSPAGFKAIKVRGCFAEHIASEFNQSLID